MKESAHHFSEHESIVDFAELSNTESLPAAEKVRLQEHLSSCEECREVYDSFQWLREQVKVLPKSPEFGAISSDDSWEHEAEKNKLFVALHNKPETQAVPSGRKLASVSAAYRWMGLAASACAVIAISVFAGYRLAGHTEATLRGPTADKNGPSVTPSAYPIVSELRTRIGVLEANLHSSQAQNVVFEDREKQSQEQIAHLRDSNEDLGVRNESLQKQEQQQQQALEAASKERASIADQLNQSKQTLESVQNKLANIHQQSDQDVLHTASLEMQVQHFAAELGEKDKALAEEQKFLASDRDIRELMGARQLYIADVVDVDNTGQDRKPFGRVFYTKGKSLIFYGFDLDQQKGFRNASVFQVWGHTNDMQDHPLDLGVFYKDDDTNRRWVLRLDDPHALAQIDAVFVTLESHGPSKEPTGKPFLYTYLRKREPNHP